MSLCHKKIVAIHQPNFFPWLGYFDKVARSDVFIFLDDVQFPKTGGVWSNRVKLLISGEAKWVTAAIDRNYHGFRNINEMHYLHTNSWQKKMMKSLEFNYQKHPYYSEVLEVIEPLIRNQESNIADYNIRAVMEISRLLGLVEQTEFKRSSQMHKTGASNELLITLTQSAGGDTYMCGGGAEGYQDQSAFESSGIYLHFQNFTHPTYPQMRSTEFISGLSIIDAAMNMGWKELSAMIKDD